jgi:MtN3 and saliva related transmembrane protein
MISWIEIVGLAGGVLSCVSFVPQLIKLFRERTAEGISRRMYFVTVSAFAIWTLYGVLVDRSAIIISNAVCLLLSATILGLQFRYSRASKSAAPKIMRNA